MTIFSKNQLTVKEIWLTSLQLYRKSLAHVWSLAIIIGVIVTCSLLFNVTHAGDAASFNVARVILFVVVGLITAFLTSSLLHHIYNIGNEQSISLKDSMFFVATKYITLAVSMLIVFVLSMLGIILIILPGIFILVSFAMVQPLILFDAQGVMGALKGSFKLVWGNWWRTFAVVFPLIFIGYWVSYVVGRVAIDGKWYLAISNVLFAVIFYPLFYSCILVLFNDLKLRKSNAAIVAKPLENL